MNLNSRLFDSIRVKPDTKPAPEPNRVRCDFPGCDAIGEFRAPQGRDREGQFFCFCLDHVREYNASYNYFNGMSETHFAITVVSRAFQDKSRIDRHRIVNALLAGEMGPDKVHALAIDARAPGEQAP